MNCAICSRDLADVNNLKRSQCSGCWPGNKKCSYLFEKCSGINRSEKGNATARFCFECDQYPCKQMNRMDDRYRRNYGMSVKDNLESIQKIGVEKVAKDLRQKYRCPKCGGVISVHNRKCFKCDSITSLVKKRNQKYSL